MTKLKDLSSYIRATFDRVRLVRLITSRLRIKRDTSDMIECVMSSCDAALYMVEGADDEPPRHIRKILELAPYRKIYPVKGGHLWKVPYAAIEKYKEYFDIEIDGWNHGHCSCCGATIEVGDQCWTIEDPISPVVWCCECQKRKRKRIA